MSNKIIACVGQKGGVGKSIIAQMTAVHYAKKGKAVSLIDLDTSQRTSYEWGQTREINGYKPVIKVDLMNADERTNGYDFRDYESNNDILVLDAPGWSDEKTLKLSAYSDQIIMPSGASTADMRPTIRLMHEIVGKGVDANKISPVLCRVQTAGEINKAREYFETAGYRPMPGMLRELPSYRGLQNQGLSAIEAEPRNKSMLQEAKALVKGLATRLDKTQSANAEKPERYKEKPEIFDAKKMDMMKDLDKKLEVREAQKGQTKPRGQQQERM